MSSFLRILAGRLFCLAPLLAALATPAGPAHALTVTLDTAVDARPLGFGATEPLVAVARFGPALGWGARPLEALTLDFLGTRAAAPVTGGLAPILGGVIVNATDESAAVAGRMPGTGPYGGYRLDAITLWLPGVTGIDAADGTGGRLILDLLDTGGTLTRLVSPLAPGSLAPLAAPPVQASALAPVPAVPLPPSALFLLSAAGLGLLVSRRRDRPCAPWPSAPSPGRAR